MRLTGFCRVLQLSVLQTCDQYHPCFTTLVQDHSACNLKATFTIFLYTLGNML